MPPFPGPKGEEIFNNVSKQAWTEWMAHQTTLINEMRLNMMDLTARTYLAEQREKFFDGEQVDQAEGYVPPEE
jgi:Fe-S cluster biosynthesis and repair protein YggX